MQDRADATAKMLVAVFTLALAGIVPAGAAEGVRASAWDGPAMVQSRVIVGNVLPRPDGTVIGGLELRLEDGWFTYWRTPGEAGAPPAFDWSGSHNVRDIRIFFPAPTRKIIEGHAVNGYPEDVVLPVLIVPERPFEPIRLALKVSYAVCSEVCVPVQSTHALRLKPVMPIMGASGAGGPEWTREDEALTEKIERAAESYMAMAELMAEHYAAAAEDAARAAEDYAALIEQAIERVPQPDPVLVEALKDEVKALIRDTLRGRALTIELRMDRPLKNPQVFVEGPGQIVFGQVHTELVDGGRRIIVTAPISRGATKPLDGHTITVTVVDEDFAFEETISVSRRTVVRLPWPGAVATSPDPPEPPTPPPAPRPE